MKNNKVDEFLKTKLQDIKNMLKSKTMLCAMYAYKYEKTKEMDYYSKFNKLWKDFSSSDKEKVIGYFYSFNDNEMLMSLKIQDDNYVQKQMDDFISLRYAKIKK